MKHSDMVMLTKYVQAMCPAQKIDEFTPDAWMDVLGDLRAADCREAIRRVAGKRQWISPADIRSEVRILRAERIEQAPPMELPAGFDPDDTEAYRAAVREYYRRAADGEPLPQPAALRPRNMAAIEGTFRSVPAVRP